MTVAAVIWVTFGRSLELIFWLGWVLTAVGSCYLLGPAVGWLPVGYIQLNPEGITYGRRRFAYTDAIAGMSARGLEPRACAFRAAQIRGAEASREESEVVLGRPSVVDLGLRVESAAADEGAETTLWQTTPPARNSHDDCSQQAAAKPRGCQCGSTIVSASSGVTAPRRMSSASPSSTRTRQPAIPKVRSFPPMPLLSTPPDLRRQTPCMFVTP